MAGLLSKTPMPESGGKPPGMPDEMPMDAAESGMGKSGPGEASPEEQEQLELFMANVGNVMYDAKTLPALVKRLGTGAPADAIGQAAASIIARVEESANQNGMQVDGDLLLHAGKETVQMLGEIAAKVGIELTDDQLNQAMLLGVDYYRALRQKQGKLNPEPFQRDVETLKSADAEGRIEEVAPGLTEFAKRSTTLMAPPQKEETNA